MYGVNGNAEPRSAWPSREKIANGVTGDGERKASGNHGINSDHMATGVSQRATGVTRGESHGCLYPGLVAKRAQRADRVNHSGCQRPDKSERIADGNGKFAGTQLR